jgi:cellulose synthase/poly-beta-1,6-N-acetylglucosamine synthase-like glycosyltransferase
MVVRNEEERLEDKLQNLLSLDYPACQIIVVSDGSSDGTEKILRAQASRLELVLNPDTRQGVLSKRRHKVGSRRDRRFYGRASEDRNWGATASGR